MTVASTTGTAPVSTERPLPPALTPRLRAAIFLRLLAVQGSWNYEILVGNGIAFCVEPALRHLPGGTGGEAYREALARQSAYFNSHPYLAAVAVGALARAELDGEAPARIERFRTALCGPLGSLGDRLVWAAWLPACALVALLAYGVGAGPLVTVLVYLGLYNVGHLAVRLWGLNVGMRRGLQVAGALGTPWLRDGPAWIGRAGAALSGVAIPLALYRMVTSGAPGPAALVTVLAGAAAGAVLLSRLPPRLEAWRVAIAALAFLILLMVVR